MAMGTIADDLIRAHKTGQRIGPPAQALARDQILGIQTQVAAALGPVAGFKVSRVASGPPILAPLLTRYMVKNGGTRPVRDQLGVELEIGFRVIRPLPHNLLPARPQDYLHPHAVLELVDSRFDSSNLSPQAKFCDFQMNAGLVVGAGPDQWDGSDFDEVQIRLDAGNKTVKDGIAMVPGGSACSNLDLLLSDLGKHCGGVQVGQVLITGSLNGLPYFPADTTIDGAITGLGRVSVTLTQDVICDTGRGEKDL